MKVAAKLGARREYGLRNLWDMVVASDADPSDALSEKYLDSFVSVLCLTQARDHVDTYLGRCVDHLRRGTCVLPSMRVIRTLVLTFPASASATPSEARPDNRSHRDSSRSRATRGHTDNTQAQVLASLQRRGPLLQVAVQELQRYGRAAEAVYQARMRALARGGISKSDAASQVAAQPLIGRRNHADSMRLRLEFITFLVDAGGSELGVGDVQTLAGVCCAGDAGHIIGGAQTFFQWLRDVRFGDALDGGVTGTPVHGIAALALATGGVRQGRHLRRARGREHGSAEVLTDAVTVDVFRRLLCDRVASAEVQHMVVQELDCFKVRCWLCRSCFHAMTLSHGPRCWARRFFALSTDSWVAFNMRWTPTIRCETRTLTVGTSCGRLPCMYTTA